MNPQQIIDIPQPIAPPQAFPGRRTVPVVMRHCGTRALSLCVCCSAERQWVRAKRPKGCEVGENCWDRLVDRLVMILVIVDNG